MTLTINLSYYWYFPFSMFCKFSFWSIHAIISVLKRDTNIFSLISNMTLHDVTDQCYFGKSLIYILSLIYLLKMDFLMHLTYQALPLIRYYYAEIHFGKTNQGYYIYVSSQYSESDNIRSQLPREKGLIINKPSNRHLILCSDKIIRFCY